MEHEEKTLAHNIIDALTATCDASHQRPAKVDHPGIVGIESELFVIAIPVRSCFWCFISRHKTKVRKDENRHDDPFGRGPPPVYTLDIQLLPDGDAYKALQKGFSDPTKVHQVKRGGEIHSFFSYSQLGFFLFV